MGWGDNGRAALTHHLLEEVRCRRTRRYRDPNRLGQPLGLRRGAEERVDRRRCVEVRYPLFLQEAPYQGVVDLSEAVVRPADGCHGPAVGKGWVSQ